MYRSLRPPLQCGLYGHGGTTAYLRKYNAQRGSSSSAVPMGLGMGARRITDRKFYVNVFGSLVLLSPSAQCQQKQPRPPPFPLPL
jgi:hypothetical protein